MKQIMGEILISWNFAWTETISLNDCNLSKMTEKIKLQLICIVEHILLESPRAEMCRKQPLENKQFAHFGSWF
jgi:hypothetical protein